MRAQPGQGELFGEATMLPEGFVYERDFIPLTAALRYSITFRSLSGKLKP